MVRGLPSLVAGDKLAGEGGESVEIPDFKDFLASLDQDTVSGIMLDANNAAKIAQNADLLCEEDRPGLQVLSMSYQVSLGLLAVYHKWLEQQL